MKPTRAMTFRKWQVNLRQHAPKEPTLQDTRVRMFFVLSGQHGRTTHCGTTARKNPNAQTAHFTAQIGSRPTLRNKLGST